MKIESWFVLTLMTLVLWGLWGFFTRLSTKYVDPKSALIYEVIGTVIVGVTVMALAGFKPQLHPRGALFGILTGVVVTLGSVTFLYAVSQGKTAVVVTVSALYPVVTLALAFAFLHEPITFKQVMGIIAALIAIVLFAT